MIQTKSNTNVAQRNYGIDLLRLVAAFYVIILHIMNYGGLYSATAPNSYQQLLCKVLLILSFCAVNIFGIISGYVGYREPLKKLSYSSYLQLWLTVVFYCVLSVGFYQFLLPAAVTGRDLTISFFPVTNNLFWYFSAYTFVYFFSPFLNRLLHYSSEKELKQLFFLICCMIVPIEYVSESFGLTGGYSAIWLLLLYLIGGILKKTGIGSKLPSFVILAAIILIDLVFLWLGLNKPFLTIFSLHLNFDVRYSYVTPFYLATAILQVILFARIKVCKPVQSIIHFAAPAAFSVYIANTTPLFFNNFMQKRFVAWGTSSPIGILVRVALFSGVFLSAVVIIDFLRRKLFRVLGVQNWLQNLSGFFYKSTVE